MQVGLLPLRDGLRGAHDGVLGEQCVGPLSPVHLSSCDQSASGCRSFMVGAALCAGGSGSLSQPLPGRCIPERTTEGSVDSTLCSLRGMGGYGPKLRMLI